jgi:toxin ParE1/3/4
MPKRKKDLEWTRKAENDLEAIRSFIAKDKPIAADRFIQRILRAVENLRRFPYLGQMLVCDENSEIREINVKSYRIIFRVSGDIVRIITLIHAARNPRFLERELENLQ